MAIVSLINAAQTTARLLEFEGAPQPWEEILP